MPALDIINLRCPAFHISVFSCAIPSTVAGEWIDGSTEREADCNMPRQQQLTDSQNAALQEFKKNISDVRDPHDTDVTLIKWLRARNYDIRKSEVYYREMQAMNLCYELDKVYATYSMPEVAEKYVFTAFLGYAKDGTIVRYNPIGKGDHPGFLSSLNAYEVTILALSFIKEDLKRQRAENIRTGKNIHEITYIFDMEGFSVRDYLHKAVLETGLDFGCLVQDYYPEIWGNIFFINLPAYFELAYSFFRPILRHTVLQRIKMVSRDKVPQVLLRYIDADVLPKFLGGNRVDSSGNPRCTEFIRFGGKIPEKYYFLHSSDRLLSEDDLGARSVWIPARGSFNHSVAVREPGTRFRIEYRVEQGSIYITKLYRKFGRNPESDMPSETEYLDEKNDKHNVLLLSPGFTAQAHLYPLDYTAFMAAWPGIYIFRFSNIHSWFGARRLIFRITPIEPES